MKIRILCLGRLNKGEENELCKRYEGRLKSLKNSGINSFSIEHISKKELENIIEELKKMGIKGCKVEGRDSNNWKLIDAIDVIVHIFHHEQRKNYELEKMWADIIPNQKIFV